MTTAHEAFAASVSCLEELEDVFGDRFELTLVARCTDPDCDGDMVVTKDDLGLVRDAVERRRQAETSAAGEPATGVAGAGAPNLSTEE